MMRVGEPLYQGMEGSTCMQTINCLLICDATSRINLYNTTTKTKTIRCRKSASSGAAHANSHNRRTRNQIPPLQATPSQSGSAESFTPQIRRAWRTFPAPSRRLVRATLLDFDAIGETLFSTSLHPTPFDSPTSDACLAAADVRSSQWDVLAPSHR